MHTVGFVAVVALCLASLVGRGASSNPWESFLRKNPLTWESLGSRLAAPGIFLEGVSGGQRTGPPSRPVTVQCLEADMVVTVQRDLFGTGRLVQPGDLRLGAAFCSYKSVNANNTVTFQSALQDCGNTLQVTPTLLVYSSILTYNPAPSASAVIIRSNPVSVLVQCLYPRDGNVSSNPIRPTWIPFSSTVSMESSLAFSLRLMNDDWSAERTTTTFQLGDVFHIEASVHTGSHMEMRVLVDSCVATLTPAKTSSPRYDIIASNGCLVDGKLPDSSSAFISPRSQPNTLQFTVDSFIFIGDSRSLIYITCNLKAVDASMVPSAENKACSYSQAGSSWSPVEGSSAICSCCDTSSCVRPLGGSRFGMHSRRARRSEAARSEDTVAVLGPLVIVANEGRSSMVLQGEEKEPWSVLGLGLVGLAVLLSLVTLGAVVVYKRCRD
ncbi:zona pellucida sperm-binding protein 3-like [Lissotriton helveticus]